MTRSPALSVFPLLLVLAALAAPAAFAQDAPGQPRMVRVAQGGPQERSMSDTIRRVQRTTGGQILGAERVPFDGRDINRVKYLDDRGRVRYMDDPAPAASARPPRQDPPAPQPPHGNNS